MISVRNLNKTFDDVEAVRDVSFDVAEGETMVLLGTSGCGKTTTLKMLNRLIEATSGSIHINNQDIFRQQPELLRRTIGYVSQNNGLFPHYTVLENIAVVPRLLRWEQKRTQERSAQLLEQLKLPVGSFGNKYPDALSGGQQQRVALARALVADPPILLMDEPFGALDPVTRADVRRDFAELPELKRKTIVLVTHDVQEAFELGDSISLMHQGQIVQSGSAAELIFQPKNDFVSAFFNQQRLLLELGTLRFQDVWEHFPAADPLLPVHLDSSSSLWEGMEMLSDTGLSKLVVERRVDKSFKIITLEAIQSALKLKKHKS